MRPHGMWRPKVRSLCRVFLRLCATVGFSKFLYDVSAFWISCACDDVTDGREERGESRERLMQPHIVFILADDLGWGDVGYHGSEIRTPWLDRLAREGVRLENYYVQPLCTPSRSQLMSGMYQIHTGLQHGVILSSQPHALPISRRTLPERLRTSGYVTHMVGKWHLGFYKREFTPHYRGFDTFFGSLTCSGDHFRHTTCERQPHGHRFCGLDLHRNDDVIRNLRGKYSTQIYAERAIQLIRDHDETKPLFLYVAFQAVHSPLQAPRRYVKQYRHRIKDPRRRRYAAMATCMDEAIGNITKSLKQTGLWKNSILIFSTDNGADPKRGGSNWPLRGSKSSLWEGGVRGVAFVSSPLLQHPQRVSRDLIHISDWFPTLLNLGQRNGSAGDLKLDGYDVWQTISESKPSPRTELLHNIDPLARRWGRRGRLHSFDTRVAAALRYRKWKLITGWPGHDGWYHPSGTKRWYFTRVPNRGQNVWLFDVERDPRETVDVSHRHPRVVRRLLQKLSRYNATAVPAVFPPQDPHANPTLHGHAWVPWVT